MLPDPLALRGAASALMMTSTQVRRLCAEVTANVHSIRWSAPAVDVIRRGLALSAGEALTGAWALEAGASHLQTVALAIEDLHDTGRRLRAAAEAQLLADIAAATSPLAVEAAQRALELLSGPDDPHWAQVAGIRPVALPTPGTVPAEPVAPSPAGLVDADLAGVQGLADMCRSSSGAVTAAGGSTRARVGALGLAGLDVYGMAGSRSEQWLATTAVPLLSGAERWGLAARECDLLVRLLSAADRPGDLLADPRLADALRVLEAQLLGPGAVAAALAALPPVDREWVADIAGVAPAPVAQEPAGSGLLRPPSWIELPDWLHSAWQGISEAFERLEAGVKGLVAEVRALRRAAQALQGDAKDSLRRQARELLSRAHDMRRLRDRWGAIARASGMPRWLRNLDRVPLIDRDGLRGISRIGAIGAVIGIVWDITHGSSVREAVIKGVFLAAVGALAGAAVVVALVALPVELSVLGALVVQVLVGAAAVYVAGRLFDAFARPIWGQVEALPGRALAARAAVRRVAEQAEGGLEREADKVSRAVNRIGRLMGSGSGGHAHAPAGSLGRLVPPAVVPLLASAATGAVALAGAAAAARTAAAARLADARSSAATGPATRHGAGSAAARGAVPRPAQPSGRTAGGPPSGAGMRPGDVRSAGGGPVVGLVTALTNVGI